MRETSALLAGVQYCGWCGRGQAWSPSSNAIAHPKLTRWQSLPTIAVDIAGGGGNFTNESIVPETEKLSVLPETPEPIEAATPSFLEARWRTLKVLARLPRA